MSWIGHVFNWLGFYGRRRYKTVTGHKDFIRTRVEIDDEGWLWGPNVVHYPSVRCGPLQTPNREPIAVVWHYTATKWGTAKSLAKRIQKYKRGKDRPASWHLLISHKGTIYQSVGLQHGAWHCARGKINNWRINKCTVGIELEGHGDAFPAEQVEAAKRVMMAIHRQYTIPPSRLQFGHDQFDPARRADPGALWYRQLKKLTAPME